MGKKLGLMKKKWSGERPGPNGHCTHRSGQGNGNNPAPSGGPMGAASCWVPDLAEQRLRLKVMVPAAGPWRRLGSAGSGGEKYSGSF